MESDPFQRWPDLDARFAHALDLPPAERAAFLEQVGEEDPDLRQELERLLAAHEASEAFLETPAGHVSAPRAGARVGPYRLVEAVGSGGMGTVFRAERADGAYERTVAVKLLRPGPVGDAARRRFEAERRILARLQHPNVARLLGGGVTEDGLPWLAMEYAEGRPVTDYCDAHRLSVEARLRLFLDVCAAVAYAHQHLVVHRDLKPSNVLVTEDGAVKLLDFGIAKLLGEAPALTLTGLRPMTPEYAAPEQVQGHPVSTATDVYQLGVLLYELLTGRRPYRLPTRVLHEVARIICEETPERPSTAVTHVAGPAAAEDEPTSPEALSAARGTRPERLRRTLAGDLDNVVLMALRKEPERRYASAEGLGEDLRRHLAHLPVRARPDTLAYRASRFVRRHRAGVGMAVLLTLLLLGFAGAMALQARRVAAERDRAEHTVAFLTELFEALEPVEARGATVRTRDLLDQGVARARREFREAPLLQADLLDVLGQVYQLRGHFPEAEPLLREALALREAHLVPDHLDVAESQHHLGLLLDERDRGDDAEPLLRAAFETRRRRLGPAHPLTAYAQLDLATALRTEGDLDAAEAALRAFLDTFRDRPGMDMDVSTALTFLGRVVMEQGALREAEPLLDEALAIRRGLFGNEHPTVANALDALGALAEARGDLAAAEARYREALAIREQIFEPGHTDLAAGYANLGAVLHAQGRDAEAEPLLREALAIARPAFGDEHGIVRQAEEALAEIQAPRP